MRLYITVETTSRELEGKTLLACHAAAEGFDVVIGLEDMVRRLAVIGPRGIFYDKSTHSEYPGVFASMRRMGHHVAVNDEEGLIIIPERYREYCLTPSAEENVDLLLTWGEHQHRIVCAHRPRLGEKSAPVGNARMDLLRRELRPFHQAAADRVTAAHGRFVLINTRCGIVNNVAGTERMKERIDAGRLGPVEIMQRFFARDMRVFEEFQDMLHVVGQRFPDKTFVVRPHPSESLVPWQRIAAMHPNVRVIREGNVHQWILAADMVIQHGCSTAVESYFLETPCVSFHPVVDEDIKHSLSDAVSFNVFDVDTLCRCISGELAHEIAAQRDTWTRNIQPFITSAQGPLAITATVDHLKRLAGHRRLPDFPYAVSRRVGGMVRSWSRLTKRWVRTALGREKAAGDNAKWKPLSVPEYSALVRRFSFFDPRFATLEVSRAYPECFRLRLPGSGRGGQS